MFNKNKTSTLDEIRTSLLIHNNIMIYKEFHKLGVISDEEYKEILRRLVVNEWVL